MSFTSVPATAAWRHRGPEYQAGCVPPGPDEPAHSAKCGIHAPVAQPHARDLLVGGMCERGGRGRARISMQAMSILGCQKRRARDPPAGRTIGARRAAALRGFAHLVVGVWANEELI